MLWVQDELSYDKYNVYAYRIYRINTFIKQDSGNNIDMAMTTPALASALRNIPEVENVVRLQGPGKNVVVRYKDNLFNEDNFFFADASIFKIFSLPVIEGDPETALTNPNSLVLTQSMAYKYFGRENPVGKFINVRWNEKNIDFQVTGIIKNIPNNSHFHLNFVASLNTLESIDKNFNVNWYGVKLYTYVLLSQNAFENDFNNKLKEVIKQNMGSGLAAYWSLSSQKLTNIHLHSHRLHEIEANGNSASVYIFTTAGFLILLIAIINFISLTTAKYADRVKEVGVRKVMGADRKELSAQFIYENISIVLFAFIIAMSLVEIIIPYFNAFTHKRIDLTFNSLIFILIISLAITSIGACIPAFSLSSFSPLHVLSKRAVLNPGGTLFRKVLIVIQFSIAISLIICSLFINGQMNFIFNRDLGIKINNTVLIPLKLPEIRSRYPLIKNQLLQLTEVKDVSASSDNPVNMNMINSLYCDGKPVLEIKTLAVDNSYLKTMGLKVINGRDFSPDITTDTSDAILINKAAEEKLNALHLSDKQFGFHINNWERNDLRVIGVVNNYNYRPLYYKIEPMIFYIEPQQYRFMEVKISSNDLVRTINKLKEKWGTTFPNTPFDFTFLDQDLKKEYDADLTMRNVLNIFSILAIFTGCLGLFGLAAFSVEKRTKEIGIRKILGSSIGEIIILLSKDFLTLIFIAGLISVPFSLYFISKWLNQFAFRIGINPFVFAGVILIVMLIAFLTIGIQSIKAARVNPIESLRYE